MNTGITLADGQVAAAATSLGTSLSGLVNVTFCNVGGLSETVVVTLLRQGGTARRVARAVLAANEALVVAGLQVHGLDTLKASTTDANSVDYVVSSAPDSSRLQIYSLDANGALKQVNTGVSGNQTVSGNLAVTGDFAPTTETLAPGASTAAAGTTTADAGVLPAGTAGVYPTTAADGTKGVRVSATDKVTGRMIFVGNGVSNQILKVYAPSGGTINGAAADAAFSSASGKGVVIYCLSSSGNTWLAW